MNKIVIVDIDGTVSEVGDRVNHLNETPCNWDDFYERCNEDKPIIPIIDLVTVLTKSNYSIVFITGRRESTRGKTVSWLKEYGIYSPYLFMRPDGNFQHDTIVKPELLNHFFNLTKTSIEDVFIILEDRNSMVKKWRELGYTCLQVAEGDF